MARSLGVPLKTLRRFAQWLEAQSIAKLAKEQGSDAIHDTVHEMAKDEARHCAGFAGLYKRYFK